MQWRSPSTSTRHQAKVGAEPLSYMSGHDSGGWHGRSQTFRTGRPPVGGLYFFDVSGTLHELTGTWAVMKNSSPELETRVSCSWSQPTTGDPHALGGGQCGAQRRPDLQHIRTQTGSFAKQTLALEVRSPWLCSSFSLLFAAHVGVAIRVHSARVALGCSTFPTFSSRFAQTQTIQGHGKTKSSG